MRRVLAFALIVPLAGCALPVAAWTAIAAMAGAGTAVVTLDTHVFDDCVAGKPSFNCETPAK
jgi:hypothetical protein